MITDALYHIYVNDVCVKNNLEEVEFKREMKFIEAFLELTNLDKSAKVEYVQCDPPSTKLLEGSY